MQQPLAGRNPYGNKLLLGAFRAIERTALHTLGHAGRIESATNDVITDAGQVANAATADQYHTMLLQIVTDTGDIASIISSLCWLSNIPLYMDITPSISIPLLMDI